MKLLLHRQINSKSDMSSLSDSISQACFFYVKNHVESVQLNSDSVFYLLQFLDLHSYVNLSRTCTVAQLLLDFRLYGALIPHFQYKIDSAIQTDLQLRPESQRFKGLSKGIHALLSGQNRVEFKARLDCIKATDTAALNKDLSSLQYYSSTFFLYSTQ